MLLLVKVKGWGQHSYLRSKALFFTLNPENKVKDIHENLCLPAENKSPTRFKGSVVSILTLLTLDMMANTAESVISVVSMPCCAKLLARS